MSEKESDLSKRNVVYRVPGMGDVIIRRDIEYSPADSGPLIMDLYQPHGQKAMERFPAVIIVAGYPDPGFARMVSCRFKEMGSSVSWAKLLSASGMIAITYTNLDPAPDIRVLLEYIRRNAEPLGIDKDRLGLWASSGNVPLALSVLLEEQLQPVRCAALCYGYTLDQEGFSFVADAARQFGFANPAAGKTAKDLNKDSALLVVRAGQDRLPHLNETLDRFLADAIACNLNITFINHADGPHAFDLLQDSEASREIVRQTLAFLRFHLYK